MTSMMTVRCCPSGEETRDATLPSVRLVPQELLHHFCRHDRRCRVAPELVKFTDEIAVLCGDRFIDPALMLFCQRQHHQRPASFHELPTPSHSVKRQYASISAARPYSFEERKTVQTSCSPNGIDSPTHFCQLLSATFEIGFDPQAL